MKEHCVTVTQNQGDSSTGKLKDICGSPHIEKEVTFTQKKENYLIYNIYNSHK